MNLAEIIAKVDQLKSEIEALRPLDPEQQARIIQKFRLDWNYHSNAIEGNTLTLGETRAFLLHGLTAKGKPFKDYLDIKGHNEAIAYLEAFVKGQEILTETVIRELHKILLVEPYEVDAVTHDGQITRRRVAIGQYKTMPNHVRTSLGAIHYYATPEETPAKMGDLMQWYRTEAAKGDLHPLILAATFHYRFVAIHPFDDGNGRMARLLTNLILMQAGYVPVIIRIEAKPEYLLALEEADVGNLEDFVSFIGAELITSMELYVRGARGESIEELEDLDKKIALLQKRIEKESVTLRDNENLIIQRNIELFNNLLKPFLERLFTNFTKFDSFFKHSSCWLTYTRGDGMTSSGIDKLGFLLEQLQTTIKENSNVSQVGIIYELRNFIIDEQYHIKIRVNFNLETTKFNLQYFLEDSPNKAQYQEELIRNDYGQSYGEEDIDQVIFSIVNNVYGLIEQKTNGHTAK